MIEDLGEFHPSKLDIRPAPTIKAVIDPKRQCPDDLVHYGDPWKMFGAPRLMPVAAGMKAKISKPIDQQVEEQIASEKKRRKQGSPFR